ncbi:MAG: SDR family NAD(P)-dependent oxidoreductase [Planctomycetota bacterium]
MSKKQGDAMVSDEPGKTAMLSGSTGGLGAEIAKLLAGRGWDLALLNRSEEKSRQQQSELRDAYPDVSISTYKADLLDQTSIVAACHEIAGSHPNLSAIYNVAGLLTGNRISSRQGIEGHFAINTVAPYLICQHLCGVLEAAQQTGVHSVVVNLGSSAADSLKSLDVQSLADPDEVGGLMGAYANSKLALTAMTLAMGRESGVSWLTADPGPTKTSMTRGGDGMPWFLRPLVPLLFKPADLQAKRLVDAVELAAAENASGLYISQGRRKPVPASAQDLAVQSDVMNLLAELTSQTADERAG